MAEYLGAFPPELANPRRGTFKQFPAPFGKQRATLPEWTHINPGSPDFGIGASMARQPAVHTKLFKKELEVIKYIHGLESTMFSQLSLDTPDFERELRITFNVPYGRALTDRNATFRRIRQNAAFLEQMLGFGDLYADPHVIETAKKMRQAYEPFLPSTNAGKALVGMVDAVGIATRNLRYTVNNIRRR